MAVEIGALEEGEKKLQEEDRVVGSSPKEEDDVTAAAAEEKVIGKGEEEKVVVVVADGSQPTEMRASRLQTNHPVAPIHIVSPPPPAATPSAFGPTPTPPQLSSLNSRRYTNRISLVLFVLHLLAVATAFSFFSYKAVQGILDSKGAHGRSARRERRILKFWLPPIEAASVLSIVLAFAWQRAVRAWPAFMVRFILWSSFGITMTAGIVLLSFSLPATAVVGVALVVFSIGTGLYACWVTRRLAFTARVFARALQPTAKFRDLDGPAYLVLGVGFLWISLWCFAAIGALNFDYPPLTILALLLSLAWTAEVMRNVTNLTVSRVVSLYYLRGMQCSTQFAFQRAITVNLGSASLGSFFVPTIEALRIIARALNLLEGEDEFMFSCAHCCLRVMESIFRYGNSWAFVHIAAYGKGFVAASRSTWGLFERQGMEKLVDADVTSSICFLTGVTSGALCVILASSWTFATHRHYTATVSLLAFFVGYLMTRIGMALPQACIGCYYVCYAENPTSRLFDTTIPDRLNIINTGRDVAVSTPRFPRRHTAT